MYQDKLCAVKNRLLAINVFKGWASVSPRRRWGTYWMFTSLTQEERQLMSRSFHNWKLQVMVIRKHIVEMEKERRLKLDIEEQLIIANHEKKFISEQLDKEKLVKDELGNQLNTAQTTMKKCNFFNRYGPPYSYQDRVQNCSAICGHERELQSFISRADEGVRYGLDSFFTHGTRRAESVASASSERGAAASHVSNHESETSQERVKKHTHSLGDLFSWSDAKGDDFDTTNVTHSYTTNVTHSSSLQNTFKNIQKYVEDKDDASAQVETSRISSTHTTPQKQNAEESFFSSSSDFAFAQSAARLSQVSQASDLRSTGSDEGEDGSRAVKKDEVRKTRRQTFRAYRAR